jgi:hypothetical protein
VLRCARRKSAQTSGDAVFFGQAPKPGAKATRCDSARANSPRRKKAERVVGASMVSRLHANPVFVAQLAGARKEIQYARFAGFKSLPGCAAETKALASDRQREHGARLIDGNARRHRAPAPWLRAGQSP